MRAEGDALFHGLSALVAGLFHARLRQIRRADLKVQYGGGRKQGREAERPDLDGNSRRVKAGKTSTGAEALAFGNALRGP